LLNETFDQFDRPVDELHADPSDQQNRLALGGAKAFKGDGDIVGLNLPRHRNHCRRSIAGARQTFIDYRRAGAQRTEADQQNEQ
jgi:hypothetical protein